MRTSPQINDAMQQIYTINPYREILARSLGADYQHIEVLAELAPAIIVHRALFSGNLDPDHLSQQVLELVRDIAALAAE